MQPSANRNLYHCGEQLSIFWGLRRSQKAPASGYQMRRTSPALMRRLFCRSLLPLGSLVRK